MATLTVTPEERERARLLSEYKFVVDLQSRMIDAREDGREEEWAWVLDLMKQGLSVTEIERRRAGR
jgi:hypothetical protein